MKLSKKLIEKRFFILFSAYNSEKITPKIGNQSLVLSITITTLMIRRSSQCHLFVTDFIIICRFLHWLVNKIVRP